MTRTYAIMRVSPATYREIRKILVDAGYDHAIMGLGHAPEALDMHGIALAEDKETEDNSEGPTPPVNCRHNNAGRWCMSYPCMCKLEDQVEALENELAELKEIDAARQATLDAEYDARCRAEAELEQKDGRIESLEKGRDWLREEAGKQMIRAHNAEAREKKLLGLLEGIKWKSADKDNMEFTARITCFQRDDIRAALRGEEKEK